MYARYSTFVKIEVLRLFHDSTISEAPSPRMLHKDLDVIRSWTIVLRLRLSTFAHCQNYWRQVVLTFLILLYWLVFGNSHESKITLTSDVADITIKDWSILRKIKNCQRFPGVGQDIALSASPAARFQAK